MTREERPLACNRTECTCVLLTISGDYFNTKYSVFIRKYIPYVRKYPNKKKRKRIKQNKTNVIPMVRNDETRRCRKQMGKSEQSKGDDVRRKG